VLGWSGVYFKYTLFIAPQPFPKFHAREKENNKKYKYNPVDYKGQKDLGRSAKVLPSLFV